MKFTDRKAKMFTALVQEVVSWYEVIFIKNVPGRIGAAVRRFYWSGKFKEGLSFYLATGCTITSPENISIGRDVSIMHNCCLHAHDNGAIKIGNRVGINNNVIVGASDNGTIVIGSDVLIGPNVVIRASNHRYDRKDVPIITQGHTGGTITIEDDVWIGANCVILPDVRIGKGAVVGAGAVVTKDIQPYALAAGVPAQIVKECCRH